MAVFVEAFSSTAPLAVRAGIFSFLAVLAGFVLGAVATMRQPPGDTRFIEKTGRREREAPALSPLRATQGLSGFCF